MWGTQQNDVSNMVNPWVAELDLQQENSSTGNRKRQDINAPYMPKPIEIPGLAKAMILADTKLAKGLRNMINSARGTVYLFMVPGVVAGEFVTDKQKVRLQNRRIDVRDLGQVYIGGSWLGQVGVQNFRRSFPCYSGTSVQGGSVFAPTGREVDCTGAISDVTATGYHSKFVTRNLMEELSLLAKLCDRDKMEESRSEEECRTKCDRTLLEDACGKCAEDEVDFPDKFTNTIVASKEGYVFSDSFTLLRKNTPLRGPSQALFYSDDEFDGWTKGIANKLGTVKIIFPSRNAHGTIRAFSSKKTSISQGAKLVLGGKLEKNPARRLKFLEQNITSDLEQFYEGRADGTQHIIDGKTPWTPEQIRILSLVPGSDPSNPIRAAYLKDYHDFLEENLNIQVLEPVKTLSFKLVMGQKIPGSVRDILNVRNGLNSLSYSLDANGFSMDANFSNKPPVLPELAVTMRNLGPAMTNNNSLQSLK